MDQKGISLVLGTIALFALLGLPRTPFPVALPGEQPPAPRSSEEEEAPPAPGGAEVVSTGSTADWSKVVRLYQDALGLPGRERGGDLPALLSVLAERPAGTRLEFLVALVPDPLDSYMPERFDQAVDAIQQAYADPGSVGTPSQYLLDRVWLPWTDPDAATARTWRRTPGVLLFRDPRQGLLSTVFLVGESPKSGIAREPFRNALQVIRAFLPAGKPVRVLGPTFSGSADSLELALREDPKAEIVSGSATAQGLEALLNRPPRVHFCRTVVPDHVLQRYAYGFLAGKLGWDLSKVALLTEADTAYGQAATGQQQSQTDFVIIRFSSRLSRLRTASEREADRGGKGGLVRSSKTLLDLSLAEQGQPVDVVPQITPLTSRGNDLEIANLLETISREGIRYVGILATDVRDLLFLAERVRSFSKGIVLFTFDNNLLYAHPQVAPSMNGTLVLTSFPLFTEGQPWLPGGEWAGWRFRRQFMSELHQGVFLAARRLLTGNDVPEPRVWITVVGGGSLWPIASLPVAGERSWTCASAAGEAASSGGDGKKGRSEEIARVDLKVLLVMAVLFLLALWLRSVVPPKDTLPTPGSAARTRWLLLLGAAVLWVTGGVVTVLGVLPLRGPGLPLPMLNRPFVVALAVAYAGLVWLIARTVRTFTGVWSVTPGRGAAFLGWVLAWIAAAALMLLALDRVLPWLWMPGGIPYFYLRLRNQASGLSPVTSLMWLGGGLFLWALLELKRCRLLVRQETSWPFESCPERPLTGCAELAEDLGRILEESLFSRRFLRFWIVLVIALGFPIFLLAQILQPLAEIRPYGLVFLTLAVLLLVFAAHSFYRFVAAWRTLSALLQRLDHTRLVGAFARISGEVRWNPMKGFGWQIPTFQTVALSVQRLEDLAVHGKHVIPGGAEALGDALSRAFDADRRGDFAGEIRARKEVGDVLSRSSRDLAADLGDPEVADFIALRMVAWLRYVFAHLRNCLAGAMAP
ncbi:MAG TPA: hypothetical protein VE685_14815, partial [Thermoanaerobaculia bacterium]|nr:hypothetical protein [Thermoanaerobaculia bacterium]